VIDDDDHAGNDHAGISILGSRLLESSQWLHVGLLGAIG
jgi:hypothetical protein